jgi:hypothetical protein
MSFRAKMKQKINQTLFAYWNEVRRDRLAPRRFEIEPSQIASILPNTFILERIDSETFRYRLAGTAICEAFRREFRDSNFLEGWAEDDRVSIERLLAVVTQQGGVGRLDTVASTADGRKLAFEVVLLPLVHTHDTIDRVLGAISPENAPDWLGVEPLTAKRLRHIEVIWPNGRPQTIIDALHRQVPFLPHIRKARIVRSNRRQFRVYDGGLSKPGNDGT